MTHILFLANPCCSREPRFPNFRSTHAHQSHSERTSESIFLEGHKVYRKLPRYLRKTNLNPSPHSCWWLKSCLKHIKESKLSVFTQQQILCFTHINSSLLFSLQDFLFSFHCKISENMPKTRQIQEASIVSTELITFSSNYVCISVYAQKNI